MQPIRTTCSPRTAEVLLFTVLLLKMTETDAHAYIDPGTGSVLLQLLAGVLFAGLFTIKRWSGFIVDWFKKTPKDVDEQ